MLQTTTMFHFTSSSSSSRISVFPSHNPFVTNNVVSDKILATNNSSAFQTWSRKSGHKFIRSNNGRGRESSSTKVIKASVAGATTDTSLETIVNVKAIITVKAPVGGFLKNIGISKGLDDVADLFGKSILVDLISSELDPVTGLQKGTLKGYARKIDREGDDVKYEADFSVPESFGEVGAVLIENEHHSEMFFEDIVLDGFPGGTVGLNMTCGSWVHSKFDNPVKRIFFTNKSYLPSATPSGLREFRVKELELLRGTPGMRKKHDRVYDYDTYNDLGSPDSSPDLKRPVLGGKQFGYPRRCKTGRPRTKTDLVSESRSSDVYVPRDESFADVKQISFSVRTVYSALHGIIPSLQTAVLDPDLGFPFFTAIDQLYNEGINLPALPNDQGLLKTAIPRLIKLLNDVQDSVLCFETPLFIEKDKFAWFRDEEFARQTLAGINPHVIKLVTEWPLRSNLDPAVYGSPESLITKEIVEREIRGYTTVEKAMAEKKLFVLDYYDLFLPYVNKVRGIKGTTFYGSRTLFYLTPEGTLKPVAIELKRPPSDVKPEWKGVYTPGFDATQCWLWRLAKVHVLAHDSGYHQLISHWLRTHACTEPYIIAANRQLSQMHPIYRLLHPHFRYTMEINALAREALVNADGIIESCFAPGKYSLEVSAVIYDKEWQFDLQALPADLISRGLAVEDPKAPHGLKLAIEDFPYANDGLILWDTIKEWVSDYVNHYYTSASDIQSDQELQAFWTEVRTKGHGDKKDEPWWPVLKTQDDLIGIITTIVWVTSGHHAAVNFGQYDYSGYFPNRPTIARTTMPDEDPTEQKWKNFINNPQSALLQCFPSQIQASKVMVVLDVLSTHSPDEEYLGEKPEPAWSEEPLINAAFERFKGRLMELEGIIDARNNDPNLKNRSGAGVVPYEFLKPFSEPGVTSKGVPYSISI